LPSTNTFARLDSWYSFEVIQKIISDSLINPRVEYSFIQDSLHCSPLLLCGRLSELLRLCSRAPMMWFRICWRNH